MNTPLEVRHAFDLLTAGARAEPFPPAEVREDRLSRLERLLATRAEEFVEATAADFGTRSRHETLVADILATLDSVRHAKRHVRAWMRPVPVAPHPLFRPSTAWIEPLPLGVVGIVAPWNYPVNLALGPLAAALAAGNRALLKPSEATPRTAALIGRAVRDAFTAEEVAVVEGGPEIAQAVTALPLDHLMFTGSTAVGRRVAAAAAENLVPVTLELGGKSPVLVQADFPVATAAARIAIGKLFNAGQTCIAPDYVLLPRGREEVFLEAFRATIRSSTGEESATSLITDASALRLEAMVAEARGAGARVEPTGVATGRRMCPVLVFGAPGTARLLQEEIFGPVLPIVTYDSEEQALAFIRERPRPLAFYLFDNDDRRARHTLTRVVSGGACINDTLVHFAQENLPFGGVGQSGIGAYHGETGFKTFSHSRSVLSAAASPAQRVLAPPWGRVAEAAIQVAISRLGRLL